jgi:maleate cis-trans isomerase
MSAYYEMFHLGILVPASNIVMEDEIHRLLYSINSNENFRFHTSRMSFKTRYKENPKQYLLELCSSIPSAMGNLSRIPVSIACFGCTSAELLYGNIIEEFNIKNLKTRILTPINSIINALRCLSINNPFIVSPYSNSFHQIALNFLKANRFLCSSHINTTIETRDDLIEYSATTMKDDIRANFSANCDSIVFLCTNLPTYHVTQPLREYYGVPVISSNIALFWNALCQTSYFEEKSLLKTVFID